jgi:hypothetical protein
VDRYGDDDEVDDDGVEDVVDDLAGGGEAAERYRDDGDPAAVAAAGIAAGQELKLFVVRWVLHAAGGGLGASPARARRRPAFLSRGSTPGRITSGTSLALR